MLNIVSTFFRRGHPFFLGIVHDNDHINLQRFDILLISVLVCRPFTFLFVFYSCGVYRPVNTKLLLIDNRHAETPGPCTIHICLLSSVVRNCHSHSLSHFC